MTATRVVCAEIGTRVGIDPIIVVALINGLIQLVMICRGNVSPVMAVRNDLKYRRHHVERVLRRQCRREDVPPEKIDAVVGEVIRRCEEPDTLRIICGEAEANDDTGEYPAVTT